MVTFVRTVAAVATVSLLAQGSSAAALSNSNIQARSPFPESSIIPQLLTRADSFPASPDDIPSACQSPCSDGQGSECAPGDTNCLCTNEFSQNLANCLSCITSNAPDSLSKEGAQKLMDVAGCNDAGKPIDGHIINITATGASVTTNGASVTTNGASQAVTTNGASVTTNGASDPTNGASNGASGRGISFGMGIMGMIATVVVGNLF
ncbi:hypothetical protein VKT23_009582 [Stygiomarasmius scandens]|uniref:Extracellular membrane protein CFEM domain-containing protein n=1 Tax=Marasmiellus scandens TaxID=2682957 RepID=A0ABR1JE70_9AGAR